MNREIEFRGFDGTKWYYGDLEYNRKTNFARIHTYKNDGTYGCQYTIDPDTVGQFTGLRDKNGNKIFDGDILLWTRKNVHIEGRPIQDFSDKCVIYYDNDKCGFRFRCKLDCGSCVGNLDFSDDRAEESYIEVIGNIHANPDLLSSK